MSDVLGLSAVVAAIAGLVGALAFVIRSLAEALVRRREVLHLSDGKELIRDVKNEVINLKLANDRTTARLDELISAHNRRTGELTEAIRDTAAILEKRVRTVDLVADLDADTDEGGA